MGMGRVEFISQCPSSKATFRRYESDQTIIIPREVYARVYGDPNGRQRKKAASKTSEDGSRYTAKPRNKF